MELQEKAVRNLSFNRKLQFISSERDIVYCDAGYFDPKGQNTRGRVIVAILYKKEITRIIASVKSCLMAEFLAVVIAKKLYPGKLVVNDCKTVTGALGNKNYQALHRWTGREQISLEGLVEMVNEFGIMWERRRSSPEACMVDTATRKELTPNYRRILALNGFTIKEYKLL